MIRFATTSDSLRVAEIYAPFCTDSVISFEETPPTVAEMERRIALTLEQWPWLVFETDGEIRGYAYAGRHRDRAAYRWSTDVSAYVDPRWHRRGVGRALYTALFERLVELGYYNAFAGITLPNAASVGLHESMGFAPVGVYRSVGFKFGRWHDTGWWQKQLQPQVPNPAEPRTK